MLCPMRRHWAIAGAALALPLTGCGGTGSSQPTVTATATHTVTVPAVAPTPSSTTIPTGGQAGSLHRFGESVTQGQVTIRVSNPAPAGLPRYVSGHRVGLSLAVTITNTSGSTWAPSRLADMMGTSAGARAWDESDVLSSLRDLAPVAPHHTATLTRLYAVVDAEAPFTVVVDLDEGNGKLYWTNDTAALAAVGR